MKNFKIYRRNLLVLLSGSMLFSCHSYLDQEPTDLLSEATYYQTVAQFEAASNYLYNRWNDWDLMGDSNSDLSNNIGTDTNFGKGITEIPEDDDMWTDSYEYLRDANIVIEKAYEYAEEEGNSLSDIYTSLGTALFARAWTHMELLDYFGGVPIADKVFDTSDEDLWKPRNSRYEVIAQIISDLDQIIDNNMLPTNASLTLTGPLSIEAAKAFKARVCLYAGTWDKYVGTTTDGDGTSSGAGSTKPDGYPSVDSFLTMAKTLSAEVIDSGQFELWDVDLTGDEAKDQHHERLFMYLFCLEDALSNPWGLTKSSNKEFIFQAIYDYTYNQSGQQLAHAGGFGGNRKMMDMFLCTDGLPPHLSADFQGYMGIASEFENRDYRMYGYSKRNGRYYWDNYTQYNTDYTIMETDALAAYDYGVSTGNWGKDYADSYGGYATEEGFYYRGISAYKLYDEVYSDSNVNFGRNQAYLGLKFTNEHPERDDKKESYNIPLIRLAEMYLIFAEATCELNGGLTDAELDYSINKLRARGRVANLTNALITANSSHLNMLGEVRRERAIELFGEGYRHSDQMRWGVEVASLYKKPITMTYLLDPVTGEKTGNAYRVNKAGDGTVDTDWSWLPGGGALSSEISFTDEYPGALEGFASVKPGAMVVFAATEMNFTLHNYLNPLPTSQIDLYKAAGYSLLQNPGY